MIQPVLPSSPNKETAAVCNGNDSEKAATGKEMDTSAGPEERTENSSKEKVGDDEENSIGW